MAGPSKGISPTGGTPAEPDKQATRSNVSGRNYSTDPEDRVRKSGIGFHARFEDEALETQPLGSRQWKRSPPPSPIDMQLIEEKRTEDMNKPSEQAALARHEVNQARAKDIEAQKLRMQDERAQRQPPQAGGPQSFVAGSFLDPPKGYVAPEKLRWEPRFFHEK
ncbi:MAG: hypothetical protein ACOYKZ_03495 [Chlamydiia bacterium]